MFSITVRLLPRRQYPTISRRQVMLTVEKDSLKAFAKSLKARYPSDVCVHLASLAEST